MAVLWSGISGLDLVVAVLVVVVDSGQMSVEELVVAGIGVARLLQLQLLRVLKLRSPWWFEVFS